MAANVATGLPPQPVPFVDAKGNINPVWYQFLVQLLARTGGGSGVDIQTVQAEALAAQATANAALIQAAASLKKAANLSDLVSVSAARNNLGLATQTGWTTPTGAQIKTGFNANTSIAFGALYSQSDAQNLNDQVVLVQRNVAALIAALTALNLLGP